jgi:hypothetical protein
MSEPCLARSPSHRPLPLAALLLVALVAAPARAGDLFELQVYEGDLQRPGQLGLELHLNLTFRGQTTPGWPGEVPPDQVARATLEPSLGLTPYLELGAYLQGYASPSGSGSGGWKLRTKWIVPAELGLPLRLGLNIEVAHLPTTVDQATWSLEFRPIVAWAGGRWVISFNPIVGLPLSGPDHGQATLEPALKARWDTHLGGALGLEWYADSGRLAAPESLQAQSHLLLATFDLLPRPGEPEGPWELNLGVGGGLTAETPQVLVAKAIVGRTF